MQKHIKQINYDVLCIQLHINHLYKVIKRSPYLILQYLSDVHIIASITYYSGLLGKMRK